MTVSAVAIGLFIEVVLLQPNLAFGWILCNLYTPMNCSCF